MNGGQAGVCVVAWLLVAAAFGAETRDHGIQYAPERESTGSDAYRFQAREFSIDVSGNWQRAHDEINEFFSDASNQTWGGGIGLNYFLSRHVGVGVNGSAYDNGGAFVENVAADVILRLPFDSISTAPYLLGGAGRVFHPSNLWEGHAGIGLEFRFDRYIGVFADARHMWVDGGDDRSQVRVGFRFAF